METTFLGQGLGLRHMGNSRILVQRCAGFPKLTVPFLGGVPITSAIIFEVYTGFPSIYSLQKEGFRFPSLKVCPPLSQPSAMARRSLHLAY